MFGGELGFSVAGNNYILSLNLMVSVGISVRIWLIVFWPDGNGKFFPIQPLDFVVAMLTQ